LSRSASGIIQLRRSLQIALGDAGNEALLRATSVHANFAEYVPLCLILLYLAEGQGAHPAVLRFGRDAPDRQAVTRLWRQPGQ